jgi:hypothetical protein
MRTATRKPAKVLRTLAKKSETRAPPATISHISAPTSNGFGRVPNGR